MGILKNKIFMLVILLSLSLVSAEFNAKLLTPSATFRVNESDIITHYVEVNNPNDYEIIVDLMIPNDLDINISNMNFTLSPEETKRIDYEIIAKKNVSTGIGVLFYSDKGNLAMQSSIKIFVTNKSIKSYICYYILTFFIILAMYFVIRLMFRRLKGGNKNNEKNNNNVHDFTFA